MFGKDPTDKRFADFCRTGDPDALGDVFDRTGARLIRTALWLTGDRTDADDLLQRTFLQAIETRGHFEAGRAALPWLLGLLGNQARKLRRERQRVGVAQGGDDRVANPEADAWSNELEAAVASVCERLGKPYRDVLQLHLEFGLNAKEMASRLRRPAGTVRTQLMRGLDLLREKLPLGFGGRVAGVAAVDGAALAAMRGGVMAAAGAAAPTAGKLVAKTFVGKLLAAKTLLGVPAVLLLTASAWLTLTSADGGRSDTAAVDADLAPTGDSDLDELRRLAVRASIEELVDRRRDFVESTRRDHRTDPVLWRGIERLTKAVIADKTLTDRRVFARVLAQVIEKGDPALTKNVLPMVAELRAIK